MRLPEMLVTTLERYIPINKQDLAVLRGELTDRYLNINNSIKMKNEKNAPVLKEIEEVNQTLDGLDPHSPEYQEKLLKMEILTKKLEEKTLLEKTVGFLEKPIVRVLLMVGFLIFSRWLIKRLTEKPKETEEPENEEIPQQQPPFFNQSWNPYGSNGGYWVQNPPPSQQPWQNSNRR